MTNEIMKFKTREEALKKFKFETHHILDNDEECDFMYADRSYTLEEYTLDKNIDIEDRKEMAIQVMIDNEELVIEEE